MEYSFAGLLSCAEVGSAEGIPFVMGADEHPTVLDFARIPHLLICGVTGSGKTSFLQTSLAIMAASTSPVYLRYIICSTNETDYKMFSDIKHLYVPVVKDPRKVADAVSWVLVETLRRYNSLKDIGVRDLASYNRKSSEPLPELVFVIDDLTNILSISERVSSTLQQVLLKGRQVGIHCIIVTSTTSNKSLRKDLLPYIPCRVCFTVANESDSKALLDITNATKLYYPGQLYYKGLSMMFRTHAIFIPDEELEEGIDANIEKKDKTIVDSIHVDPSPFSVDQQTETGDDDQMLAQAAEVIIEAGCCSVSLLQRRARLSYSRAARIVDQLETLGVVGPYEGAKPRTVLVNKEEWKLIAAKHGINSINEA